jgi:hypothetical protein
MTMRKFLANLTRVTPNVHKIHHSRQVSETNSNYGLDGAEEMGRASFAGLVLMPFRRRRIVGDVMQRVMLTVLFAIAVAGIAYAATRKIDFSQDAVDRPPNGFEFGYTAGVGKPGKWVVQADGENKVLAQADPDSTRSRFPVAVLSDIAAADVDLSVRFKPISGRVDQAAGLVWRYQNQDNYYIVRANALEDNVVLYKVENGKRTDLPLKGAGRTYGKKADVAAAQWSTLRVTATGPRFEVFLNGTKLYEVEDSTFTQGGKVGVWTKADSVTQFDDLTVVTK